MPASRFLKIVQETGQNSSAVSTCQFLLRGTTLYGVCVCVCVCVCVWILIARIHQRFCGRGAFAVHTGIHTKVKFINHNLPSVPKSAAALLILARLLRNCCHLIARIYSTWVYIRYVIDSTWVLYILFSHVSHVSFHIYIAHIYPIWASHKSIRGIQQPLKHGTG